MVVNSNVVTTDNRVDTSLEPPTSAINGTRIAITQQEQTLTNSTTNKSKSEAVPNKKYPSLSVKRKKKGFSLTTPNRNNCSPTQEEKFPNVRNIFNLNCTIYVPLFYSALIKITYRVSQKPQWKKTIPLK